MRYSHAIMAPTSEVRNEVDALTVAPGHKSVIALKMHSLTDDELAALKLQRDQS